LAAEKLAVAPAIAIAHTKAKKATPEIHLALTIQKEVAPLAALLDAVQR
jgi:hypothetical protein